MRDYQIPIGLSALHVYHSGVVSMPECVLRRQTGTYGTALLVSERDRDWQTDTMILEGHESGVISVNHSSDGTRIVSGSYDHTVRIWDAVSGTILHILEGHTGGVTSVTFLPDGLRIVSGSDDSTVRIWDALLGTILHTLEGHTGGVTSVTFSSDGTRIVSGSYDHSTRIWDAETGALQRTLKRFHPHNLQSILDDSALPNGRRFSSLQIHHCLSVFLSHRNRSAWKQQRLQAG
jgi:WD40 repeat protein